MTFSSASCLWREVIEVIKSVSIEVSGLSLIYNEFIACKKQHLSDHCFHFTTNNEQLVHDACVVASCKFPCPLS